MADYCVIVNDKVINMIVCDSKELAESLTKTTCIEAPWGVGIGWTYKDGAFKAPEVPPSKDAPIEQTPSKDNL